MDLNALSGTDACELRDMQLHEEAEGLVREVLRAFKTSQGRWPRTVDEIRRWIRQTPEIITVTVKETKAGEREPIYVVSNYSG